VNAPSREAAFLIRFDRDAAGVLTSVRSGERRMFASIAELMSLLEARPTIDARETIGAPYETARREVER
jgi:hypothetical protein